MKTAIKVMFLMISLTLGLLGEARAQLVNGEVSLIGDTTHFEFSGKEDWQYTVNRLSAHQVEVLVPQINAETKDRLSKWNDRLIEKVTVDRYGTDGQARLVLNFKKEIVDSFDYLTDEPSRLIIDVYEDPERAKDVAEKRRKAADAKKKVAVQPKKVDRSKYMKMQRQKRTPAGELLVDLQNFVDKQEGIDKQTDIRFHKGVYDSGDPYYLRFKIKDYEIKEEAIIASQQNIYIKFPMLDMPVNQLPNLLEFPPEYVIRPKDTEENKHVRLLKTFFDKKRYAAFLETKKFFDLKWPDSVYRQIVQFMTADVHFNMWLAEGDKFHLNQARKGYNLVLREFPESPLKERTELLLAYIDVKREDGLSAFQKFQRFLKDYPDSPEVDRVRIAMADSLTKLAKYDDANDMYADLEREHRYPAAAAEASYRKGDTQFKAGDYKTAVKRYDEALEKHAAFATKFPNAYYNKGESLFWLGEYKRSLDSYLNFVKTFPDHEHNAYALTRIGEILGILGADEKRVQGAFLESYFRFQKSPGAQIARIRLMSKKMENMSDKELNKTLGEFEKIIETSPLEKIHEFVTLMTTKGYRHRKDFDTALEHLVSYYQKNPTSANLEFFQKRIVDNIADSIKEKIGKSDFLEALKLYSKYNKTWLMNVDRIDIDFFRGRAYEMAGVYKEADSIYQNVAGRLKKIAGTREEVERKVNEHLPSRDTVNLRLANTYLEERKYPEAFKRLTSIVGKSELSPSEQMERVAISAKVYEQRGDAKSAIGFLKKFINGWQDDEALLAPAYLKMAELNLKTKSYIQAEVAADDTINLLDSDEHREPHKDKLMEAMRLKGEALFGQGRRLAAVEAFMKLLNKYEGDDSLESVRYKVGDILYGLNDLKGAEKVWSELDPEKSVFYNQLAQEKLKNAEWEDTYNKYINRLPAMKR
ncbi:MAG: hypothetical protein CL677_07250 [Bdellovibrionaceae bacterium]|nr:hypothetical protein [Pseudobdellovibrionaceae bacterium]|tara:strand:- start:26506 stop:29283 length:2778 start_codon:yes stop_codon:yes gene_type:complete